MNIQRNTSWALSLWCDCVCIWNSRTFGRKSNEDP